MNSAIIYAILAMLVVRGIMQVLESNLSSVLNALISGMAGIGHILLTVSMVILLLQIRRSVSEADK
ncbi:hypothetical protein C5Q96_04255 [Mogibacterium diversum]|uniref:DUF2871 domain-containing protein n=2 Tax=Mogibacterium diversum TaxID=114527 RepID=A0A2S0L476_9FIRM|nr:hypothetical protein C5Q96_04255 [Mogibacterium diversum]